MKRLLLVGFLTGLATAGFAAPGINLTAPTVTSWTQGAFTANAATLADLNAQLQTAFNTLAADLNTQYDNFDNLSGLNDFARGFANANMAAFDNASLLGYQSYDLFALSVGFNTSLSVPTLNIDEAASAISNVVDEGDVYAGLGTGGVAAQVGINAGFLVPNLYLSAKVGFIPSIQLGSNITAQQGMFGLGVNYTVLKPFDFGFGMMKWRGVSVGSGFVYNGVSLNASSTVDPQTTTVNNVAFDDGLGNTTNVDITASTNDTVAKLTVESSSFVIPIEVMTSLQLLWFLNIGLGVGADLNFASSKVSLGAASDLDIAGDGDTQITTNKGSAKLDINDSTGNGDIIVPRLMASFGVSLTSFKFDVPISYYPTTNSASIGFTAGFVW